MIRKLAVLGFTLFAVGCQTQPTKVTETQTRDFGVIADKLSKPIVLTENLVILDARPPFDYGLNRIQNSRSFQWINLTEPGGLGLVLKDPRQAALRLSLLGIRPESPVLIVGYGLSGQGEEGRLAWNLLYYGFKDVQTANVEVFRKAYTQAQTPHPVNEPEWKPEVRDELLASFDELNHWAKHPKERSEKRIFLIDVRSKSEFFEKSKANPDVGAIHIEWKEFFTQEGRPNPAIRAKLNDLGIGLNDQVILFDNKGLRSGAASYALLALGFTQVKNSLAIPSLK